MEEAWSQIGRELSVEWGGKRALVGNFLSRGVGNELLQCSLFLLMLLYFAVQLVVGMY